jgi:hypothetical protein
MINNQNPITTGACATLPFFGYWFANGKLIIGYS